MDHSEIELNHETSFELDHEEIHEVTRKMIEDAIRAGRQDVVKVFRRLRMFLRLRNIFAGVAAVLFVTSLVLGGHAEHILRGFAYLVGAGAYISEIVLLTNGFKRKPSLNSMFMACVFGVLYIILSISYFIG